MRGFQTTSWLALAVTTASFLLAFLAMPAAADPGAEAFAQSLTDSGFAILRDARLDERTKVQRFHDFIVQHIDARKAALFTLGQYRRGASDGALDAFVSAFADYSTAVYETHLVDFSAATMHVTGSIENKPGDVTVMAVAEGAGLHEPLRLGFRVSGSNGAYKLVDVQVSGIWLSVEQRDQFASQLAQTGGDINSLTSSLRDRVVRLRAGG